MKQILLVAFALTAAFAALASVGADEAKQPEADDIQDVLYLGEGRPSLLRLHLQSDGKPIFDKWDAWMKRLFTFLDRNNSDSIERIEATKAPTPQQMQGFLQGDLTTLRVRLFQSSVPFEQLDADRDGKVTFDEFRDYYRNNGAGPVQVSNNTQAAGGDSLTDVLFGILDADKDGKLSKAELASAESLIGRYDTNDDELVSAPEIGAPEPGRGRPQPVALDGRMAPPEEPKTRMLLVPRDEGRRRTGRTQLVRDIVAKLDKDKSGKLSQEESGFPKAMFAKLDRNRDGQLDVLELTRWISGKPDGEFTVKLGAGQRAMAAPARAVTTRLTPRVPENDQMSVKLENVRLVVLPLGGPVGRASNIGPTLLAQFRRIDRAKKGFLAKKQIEGEGNFYLTNIFDIADRNNDGRLTEAEVSEFANLYKDAFGAQASLTLGSDGRALFQSLDTNNDGQLGLRELRDAFERLREYDGDGDGCVGKNEFPQRFTLTVASGINPAVIPRAVMERSRVSMPRTPQAGPTWFRKMDRNGDGDVSRAEWLGDLAEFARIDADKDALISAGEADAADALMRKKD